MTTATPQASSPNRLGVNVFTAPGKAVVGERPRPFGEPLGWDPITSTLIYGEYDAVLVDTLTTVAEAEALADWVGLHHRNLTTIYMTKRYPDWESNQSWLMFDFPSSPNPTEDLMLRDDVLGAWELVSYTAQDNHGGPITYPLGPDALGLIMYTGDGYMSAQIMRRDRPAFDRPETGGGTPEQTEAAATGYLAYSGPFTVDESTGVLQHQPMVSLLPNWLNHTQIRHSKLDGNHLTLSAITEAPDGAEDLSTLVWKRAPNHPGAGQPGT
jgi:hypothetical protein